MQGGGIIPPPTNHPDNGVVQIVLPQLPQPLPAPHHAVPPPDRPPDPALILPLPSLPQEIDLARLLGQIDWATPAAAQYAALLANDRTDPAVRLAIARHLAQGARPAHPPRPRQARTRVLRHLAVCALVAYATPSAVCAWLVLEGYRALVWYRRGEQLRHGLQVALWIGRVWVLTVGLSGAVGAALLR